MNVKKILAAALSTVLVFSFAACGNQASDTPAETPDVPGEAPAESIVLKVGASPSPHAEILEAAKPLLAEQGITLEIQEFTDYVMPNTALDEGSLDANYFQHLPYLEDFNANNKTALVSAAAIHYEPLSLYAGKSSDLAAIADGASIAVPNDTTNEARALQLLQANGLITLTEGVGLAATKNDIVENPKNLEIVELEAAQVPINLPDVDFAVINGNYALGAGVTDKVVLDKDGNPVSEASDSEGATTFGNIIAVREGDESRPEITALVEALQSETVKNFINEKYNGLVVPLF